MFKFHARNGCTSEGKRGRSHTHAVLTHGHTAVYWLKEGDATAVPYPDPIPIPAVQCRDLIPILQSSAGI